MAQVGLHGWSFNLNMSLSHIKLPGFILADLFKTTLVDQPEGLKVDKAVEQKEGHARIAYVGKNQHQITVGIYGAGQEEIPGEHLQFMVSILKACQRNMDHVAVVNFGARELLLDEIVAQLQPQIMLLFGPYHVFGSWMIQTDDFSPFQLQKIQVVRVPPLEKMLENSAESRVLKSKLWGMLKQLFNL